MKIQSVEIRNFKNIAHERTSMLGKSVYVIGRNCMGKTSFLDAIFKILSGKDLPSKPTMTGERNGHIKLELDELIITAKFNEKNEKISLELTNKEGQPYTSPRTQLNEIIGAIDFDIDEFFRLAPKKQIEKIKSFAEIDFTDLDDQYKKSFDERTFVNRKIKELEAKQQPFDKNKADISLITDLTAMTAEINEKREHNKEIEGVGQRMFDRTKLINTNQEQIEHLEREINSLRLKNEDLEDLNNQAREFFKTPESKMFNIEAEEIAFNDAIIANETIKKNIENKKLYDEFIVELEKEKNLTKTLEDIQLVKANSIKEAKMPVSGLSFDDDGLTYHGLPFEAAQINKAQQIIIGLQMQLALLGDVKIARFDGSLIDNENLEYIEDWAQKNGLQLFIEMVDRSVDQLKIEVREIL